MAKYCAAYRAEMKKMKMREAGTLPPLERSPDYTAALAAEACGDHREQLRCAYELQLDYPDAPIPYLLGGEAQLNLDRPWDALQFFRKARALDPRLPECWHGIATAYGHLGKLLECVNALLTYCLLVPEDAAERQYLRGVCLQAGLESDLTGVDQFLARLAAQNHNAQWNTPGLRPVVQAEPIDVTSSVEVHPRGEAPRDKPDSSGDNRAPSEPLR